MSKRVAMYYGGKAAATGASSGGGGINVSVSGVSGNKAETEYVVSDAIENRSSLVVVEDTAASLADDNNSEFFEAEYLVVNDGPYKLDTAGMIGLVGKKMVGSGSVQWNEWPTSQFASYDMTMNKEPLKVRYSDDPIYVSMKIPSEARIAGTDKNGNPADFVTHPGMKPTDSNHALKHYQYINSLGAIIPVDYTQLPDEVVICIGRMAVYTLSKEPNATWKLFDYVDRPRPNAALFYLPWPDCQNDYESIDKSKIQEFENYTQYTLTREDFAPNKTLWPTSIAKTLHFWGNAEKEIDIDNTLAIIELFEVWTDTEYAAPLLYTAAGVDRKNDAGDISQAFWGRNVILSMEKTIIAGHNISDALYDRIRDTGADPRFVYDDYTRGKTWGYKIEQMQGNMARLEAAANEIEANSRRSTASYSVLEVVAPGLNINPGKYVYGYINDNGAITNPTWGNPHQWFVSADYIPVTGGRSICQFFPPAEWNENHGGHGILIVQYDANKNQIKNVRDELNQYRNGNYLTLDANTRYIKIGYALWHGDENIDTPLDEVKIAVYYWENGRDYFVPYGEGETAEFAVNGDKVVLTSLDGSKFTLSVDNDGTLSAARMT